MAKRTVVFLAVLGAFVTTPAFAFFMDFEDGLGNDGGVIAGIAGISFTTSAGLNWLYADAATGSYNVTSVDTGNSWGTGRYNMYGDVFAWLGTTGDWGRVDFDDETGTWFEINVSSAHDFYLEAYDATGSLLAVDSVLGATTQWEGYTAPVNLRVDAPTGEYISYIIVHDSGNYWEIDNIAGDMYVEGYGGSGSGSSNESIPEPASVLLLGLGVMALALRQSHKGW